ncbi:MAG: gephyrin-like molybdotransferase Glp [Nitratireductor sp.]
MQNTKTPPALMDDCFLHDKDRMRHNEALALLKERLQSIATIKTCALNKANGHILAADIKATRHVPPTDNSAVDGYAFNHAEYEKQNTMHIAGRIAAGDIKNEPLKPNTCVRIFTGAPMPQGADTVVMQEDSVLSKDKDHESVSIPQGLKQGANRRKKGEDVKKEDIIATKGTRITPQILAAIASTGMHEISIYAPLKIALISSGNELLRPSSEIKNPPIEKNYDTNHFMLNAMLDALKVEVIDYGILNDNFETIKDALLKAANECDVILTTGGASKGEEDHMIPVLQEIGKRHLWQLAVKPGRPMSFGQINKTPYFGLPGNPVASFVCFSLYVRQALLILAGANTGEPSRYYVPAGFDFEIKKPDRREFWRGSIVKNEDGILVLEKYKRDGSGLISALRESTGLIEVSEETTSVKKGDLLPFIPFVEFN